MKSKSRLEDAENTLEACSAALSLIPVWALRRDHTWLPSDDAIELIAEAKEALDRYSRRHKVGTNGGL